MAMNSLKAVRSLIIRDLVIPMCIGVAEHEKIRRQRVRINAEIFISGDIHVDDDDISKTVDYSAIVGGIRALADQGHVNLVETFVERIAHLIFKDHRVIRTKVQVEKPDVIPDTTGVGVLLDVSRDDFS